MCLVVPAVAIGAGRAPAGGTAPVLLARRRADNEQIVDRFFEWVESDIAKPELLPRSPPGLVGGEGRGGAVTPIQRFGSAANLNIHLHCLVLDGVYRSHADGVPEFIESAAPTEEGLHELLQTFIARLMKLLTRGGVLVEDDGQSTLAESDTGAEEARTLRPLQAGAVTYRIAFGPRAGRRVLTLRGAMPR
jgi:hypothetical protein